MLVMGAARKREPREIVFTVRTVGEESQKDQRRRLHDVVGRIEIL